MNDTSAEDHRQTAGLNVSHLPVRLVAMKLEEHCRQAEASFGRAWRDAAPAGSPPRGRHPAGSESVRSAGRRDREATRRRRPQAGGLDRVRSIPEVTSASMRPWGLSDRRVPMPRRWPFYSNERQPISSRPTCRRGYLAAWAASWAAAAGVWASWGRRHARGVAGGPASGLGHRTWRFLLIGLLANHSATSKGCPATQNRRGRKRGVGRRPRRLDGKPEDKASRPFPS